MTETVLIAASLMTGLAIFFAIILATAYRYLKVEEDPRIDMVEEMLPGANCGACGDPGCRAFAENVVGGSQLPGKCTVSSQEGIENIASLLGIEAGGVDKRVARLHCAGGNAFLSKDLAEYDGIVSCQAAIIVNNGGQNCSYGCLGLADCERACTFDAIHMNSSGLPVVNVDLCTSCGDCVVACPQNLFIIEPISQELIVQCNSPLSGDLAKSICTVACDSCGRCVSDAPPGVLEIQNGLPVILEPEDTTVFSTFRCPTGAIQWVEGEQFAIKPTIKQFAFKGADQRFRRKHA